MGCHGLTGLYALLHRLSLLPLATRAMHRARPSRGPHPTPTATQRPPRPTPLGRHGLTGLCTLLPVLPALRPASRRSAVAGRAMHPRRPHHTPMATPRPRPPWSCPGSAGSRAQESPPPPSSRPRAAPSVSTTCSPRPPAHPRRATTCRRRPHSAPPPERIGAHLQHLPFSTHPRPTAACCSCHGLRRAVNPPWRGRRPWGSHVGRASGPRAPRKAGSPWHAGEQ